MYKNLYFFPLIPFNNEKQIYELKPLSFSNLTKIYLFAGGLNYISQDKKEGNVYLYMESKKKLTDSLYYKDYLSLVQIISLFTGIYCKPEKQKITDSETFDNIFDKYKTEKFSNKDIQYNNTKYNSIGLIPDFMEAINHLNDINQKKFFNALYTFSMSTEIGREGNPHMKYTLQMMLFITTLCHLADDPKTICGGTLVCTKCREEIKGPHKANSERQEIQNLIDEILAHTSEEKRRSWKDFINENYRDLRSGFLHSGEYAGREFDGGFLANWGSEASSKISTNYMNLEFFTRQILKNFVTIRKE